MLGSLQVEPQTVSQGLTQTLAGTPFELDFPKPIRERPYLGQIYAIEQLALRVLHEFRLNVGQPETFPSSLQARLLLYRGAELIGVWPLEFQMRQVGASGGKEWVGEATVYADLSTPIEYTLGQTLHFAVAGVVPGAISGPSPQKPLPVEVEGQPIQVYE